MKTAVIIFLILISLRGQAQSSRKLWDYPIKPGSEQWASFTTSAEMRDACQIPEDILKHLSTKDLAEICMNYPLFVDYAFTNKQESFYSLLKERFNGMRELLNRENGAVELLNIYLDFVITSPLLKNKREKINNEYPLMRLGFIELLLSNDSIVSKLSAENLSKLKGQSLFIYEQKRNNSSIYGLNSLRNSLKLSYKSIPQNTRDRNKNTMLNKIDVATSIEELNNIYKNLK